MEGELWNISTQTWFSIAIITPILHQIYVLLCWRAELHYQYLSKKLGKKAFTCFKTGFIILFLSRFISLTLLAISNKNTIEVRNSMKIFILLLISATLIYTLHSVMKHFGFNKAFGLDHFDKSISKIPFVKRGIYKYTNNAMYRFAFLAVYLPGIIFESKASLLVAIFSHFYIWIHYYFTELPDMKIIYGKTP